MEWEIVVYVETLILATLGLLYAWKKKPLYKQLSAAVVYVLMWTRRWQYESNTEPGGERKPVEPK